MTRAISDGLSVVAGIYPRLNMRERVWDCAVLDEDSLHKLIAPNLEPMQFSSDLVVNAVR